MTMTRLHAGLRERECQVNRIRRFGNLHIETLFGDTGYHQSIDDTFFWA